MTGQRVLVQIEVRFTTTDDPNQLGERIRESVKLIVGGDGPEEFRVRTVPLVERPRVVE
jgi:hypothetical protein